MFVVNGDGESFFVGWGEWFVHERAEHVCKGLNMFVDYGL